jgi:hypothetical protein
MRDPDVVKRCTPQHPARNQGHAGRPGREMPVNRGAIAVVAVALSGCTAVWTVDAGLTSFFGNLEHNGRVASELQAAEVLSASL